MSQHGSNIEEVIAPIAKWLVQQGLEGTPETRLLEGFCQRLIAADVPIRRVNVNFRSFHPQFESLGFRWRHGAGVESEAYDRSSEVPQNWRDSPLFYLMELDAPDLHIRLNDPVETLDFPIFKDFRSEGATGYFAAKVFFTPVGNTYSIDPYSPGAGFVISFTTDHADGFSDTDLDILRGLFPSLGLAVKSISSEQMSQDLLSTYLGQDAGGRVLSGDLQRGSVDKIEAVILYFDLQGFTKLSETLPGPDVIEMLNDYFGAAVPAIHDQGGHVLKFMGDGLLAIFARNQVKHAERAALKAIDQMKDVLPKISAKRVAGGHASTGFTVGVHAGEVLYGNIGSSDRLDFTVIGSAVNTTARIAAMCSNLDQTIVISRTVAEPMLEHRPDLVSLGQYRLRGVADRQELFTLD